MTALAIITSASPPTTSRLSWRSTSVTWGALDVDVEDLVEEEEEEPVGVDPPEHLVSAGLIRWAESLFLIGRILCVFLITGTCR